MSLLDREFSRRTLLKKVAWLAAGLAAAAVVGCREEKTKPQKFKGKNIEDIAENVIGLDDFDDRQILDKIKTESQKFPLLTLNSLPEISIWSKDRQFSIPSLAGEQRDLLKTYGIEEFGLGQNTNSGNLFLVINLTSEVKVGDLYQEPPSPIPAFIFLEGENRIVASTRLYDFYYRDDELTKPSAFLNEFHIKPEELNNTKFVIYINFGLLNVKGKELPSFPLPYRFSIETPEPPTPPNRADPSGPLA